MIFGLIAFLLIITAVAIVIRPLLKQPGAKRTAIFTGLLLPIFIVLTYLGVSNYQWVDVQTVESQTDLLTMALSMEARLQEEGGDAQGWLLLGRTYAQLQLYSEAKRAFTRSAELDNSIEARLGVAEISILINRENIAGEAGQIIEQILIEAPDDPRALFYGGMVAMANNDIPTFRARWEKLLQMSPPDNIRQIIAAQLEVTGGVTVSQEVGTQQRDAQQKDVSGLSVRISISPELESLIDSASTLYLVAREPGQAGPPVAVVRRQVSSLPLSLSISDSDSMLPNRKLSGLDNVLLIARITSSGNAIAQTGDLRGEISLNQKTDSANNINILIDNIVD